MATKKYLIAMGFLAFPFDSMPLSKLISLSAVFLLGPRTLVAKMITPSKTIAKISWIPIGK
jgi:hypothetical protein